MTATTTAGSWPVRVARLTGMARLFGARPATPKTPDGSGRPGRSGPPSVRRRRIKARLAERDGQWCFYCRTPFGTLREATLDHLVPFRFVPTWVQAALVLACRPCNQAKADRLPSTVLRPVLATTPFLPGLRTTAPVGTAPATGTRTGTPVARV